MPVCWSLTSVHKLANCIKPLLSACLRGAYKIDCVQKFKEWIHYYSYNWFIWSVSFNVAALSYRKSAITGISRYRCRTQDSNKRNTLYDEITAYENSQCHGYWAYNLFFFNAKTYMAFCK